VNRSYAFLLLVLCCALGCGPSVSSSGGGPGRNAGGGDSPAKRYRIAVIPKGTNHEFWKSVHAGALKAAAERGVEVLWKGPQVENDTSGQIEVVRNFVTKRVDGICLAPNHSKALVDAVQEAGDEKIPVVIFDSALGAGANFVSYVATDNFHGGELAAERLAATLDGQGDVIMMRYRAGSESTEQREEGFLSKIKEFPGINVLSSDQYGEATTNEAMAQASQLFVKYGDQVDGVFAVCEPNCNGMLVAIENSGLAGKVKFVAFDPSDSLIRGLEEDKVHGIVLQDPVQMGYRAVMAVVDHLEGKEVPPQISTGEFVATRQNMREPQFQTLLHPEVPE